MTHNLTAQQFLMCMQVIILMYSLILIENTIYHCRVTAENDLDNYIDKSKVYSLTSIDQTSVENKSIPTRYDPNLFSLTTVKNKIYLKALQLNYYYTICLVSRLIN